MKLSELGKDTKIKHGVSSPPYKIWGNLFRMGEQTFLSKFMGGGCFTWGLMITNDQIMEGGGGGLGSGS